MPSNSISKQLANQIRDKYSKKGEQNKHASKFLRTIRFSGPLPASTKKDSALTESSLDDESGRMLVQHRTTPLADKTLSELRVNVLHTLDRAPDANQVKEMLESHGVNISLIQVPDDSPSSRHRGTIYYFLPDNEARNAARRLSKIVRAIEVVAPQFNDLHSTLGITHSIWLVGQTPSLAPKTYESHGTPTTSISCHLCGYVCHPKKLNDHLLNNHPEEAFAEVGRKLGLQKTTRASFCELQRKSFGELRWFIDACLRGWQDILNERDQKLVTADKETLFEYARILESKISGGSIRKRKDVLARLLRDIESYKARIPAKKLKWKLLPPGEAPFPKIIERFRHLSREKIGTPYDLERLDRIYRLKPSKIYMGIDEFHGYVAFCFNQKTAMECPMVGNAVYVFGENWKALSRLTKSELLTGRRNDVQRIIHKGDWFSQLKRLLRR